MELKPGYKQTEVGVIPEDWKVVEYNRIGQIIDGDRGVHYPSSGELKDAGYCLFLNAGNVTKSGFQFEDCVFITKDKDEKLNKGKLRRYDVVLTTRGTVGNFAYFDESVNHENVRINSGMVILRNTSNDIDTKYQYVVLRSEVVGLQVERMAFGSAQPQLTVKGINLFKIPLPPTTAEQTAIANALSDVDTLIQSLTRFIAKKRQIKQGTMQTLLNPYENRRLKAGWVVKKLGDIFESIQLGGNYANSEVETDFPLIKMGNLGRGVINLAKIEYIKPGIAVAEKDRLIRGDVLFNTRNTLELVGKVAIWLDELPSAYFNSNIMRLKFKSNFVSSNVYMNSLLNHQRQIQQLKGMATGTTSVAAIYTRDLIGLEIPLAPKIEQLRIATILSGMDTEIAALEAKLAKYQQIKQGMMQNLLTGKIRLI